MGAAPVGAARPGARAADRRGGGAAGRPGHRMVRALVELAALEAFAGTPAADVLTAEALSSVRTSPWTRPPSLTCSPAAESASASAGGGRRRPPIPGGRPAGHPGRGHRPAGPRAAQPVRRGDRNRPAAGAEAARAAAAQLRRAGARTFLAMAVVNLAQALLMTGDWDTAEAELAQAIDVDGLAGIEYLGLRPGLGGGAARRHPRRPGSPGRAGRPAGQRRPPGPGDIAVVEAFTAAARRQPTAALRHARAALGLRRASGSATTTCGGRGRWPPAPPTTWLTPPPPPSCWRCSTATGPGSCPPCSAPNATWPAPASPPGRRAGADAAFAAAIAGLRQHSTRYHLAHGLLDHAQHLSQLGDDRPPQPPSAKPAASPSGCAASRWPTARKPSSPQGPAPRPRDEGICGRPEHRDLESYRGQVPACLTTQIGRHCAWLSGLFALLAAWQSRLEPGRQSAGRMFQPVAQTRSPLAW